MNELPDMSATGGAVLYCLPCVLERADYGPGVALPGEPARAVTMIDGTAICTAHLARFPIASGGSVAIGSAAAVIRDVVWAARKAHATAIRDQPIDHARLVGPPAGPDRFA